MNASSTINRTGCCNIEVRLSIIAERRPITDISMSILRDREILHVHGVVLTEFVDTEEISTRTTSERPDGQTVQVSDQSFG